MIHNIMKPTFGGAGSQSGTLTGQDLNRILISTDRTWNAADYLTVTLKSSKHTPEVLVNRVPLNALADISDIENGISRSLQDTLNTASAGTDWIGYSLAVELGCLKMQATDSTLEVLLEAGAAGDFSVAACFDDDDTDYYIKTLQSTVLRDRMANVEKAYLFTTTAVADPSSESLSVVVQSQHGAFVCNAMDVYGYSSVMGKVEADGPRRAAKFFDRGDSLPHTVDYQITGTVTNYSVIVKSRHVNPVRVSAGTMEAVDRNIRVLEAKPVAERTAWKRSGFVPSISVLRAARSKMNAGIV